MVTKYTGNQLQLSRYAGYVGRNPAQRPALVYRSVADSPTIEDAMTKARSTWSGKSQCAGGHPIHPTGKAEPEPRDRQRLYRERARAARGAATRMVADLAHAVEQCATAGDSGCTAR